MIYDFADVGKRYKYKNYAPGWNPSRDHTPRRELFKIPPIANVCQDMRHYVKKHYRRICLTVVSSNSGRSTVVGFFNPRKDSLSLKFSQPPRMLRCLAPTIFSRVVRRVKEATQGLGKPSQGPRFSNEKYIIMEGYGPAHPEPWFFKFLKLRIICPKTGPGEPDLWAELARTTFGGFRDTTLLKFWRAGLNKSVFPTLPMLCVVAAALQL